MSRGNFIFDDLNPFVSCNNWTAGTDDPRAFIGSSQSVSTGWENACGGENCSAQHPLYCVEQ